jgi:hypothetical protein
MHGSVPLATTSPFAMVQSVAIAFGENYDKKAFKQNIAFLEHCPNLRAITIKIPMSELLVEISPPEFDWCGDFLTEAERRDIQGSCDKVTQRPFPEEEVRDKFAL